MILVSLLFAMALATAAPVPSLQILVLESGERIVVEGSVQEANGVATFRSRGLLYSMPMSEILRIEPFVPPADPERLKRADLRRAGTAETDQARRPIRLTEEEKKALLEKLEQNHSGQTAPPQQLLDAPPPPPTRAQIAEERREESEWRRQARAHEEAIRRAREELALLEARVDQLQSEIYSFLSLGYRPRQFTYQTSELIRAREQLPYARLEVTRAERMFEQFREDARRAGILPGWLR